MLCNVVRLEKSKAGLLKRQRTLLVAVWCVQVSIAFTRPALVSVMKGYGYGIN